MRLVVIDTNVIVSGLINPRGAPARIIDMVLAGSITVAYDDRVLAEYYRVLARGGFPFRERDALALVSYIQSTGVQASIGSFMAANSVPPADDIPFIEVAIAVRAECIITGNTRHFQGPAVASVIVLTARSFLLEER